MAHDRCEVIGEIISLTLSVPDDELYATLQGETTINVLAEADSPWSKKTEPLVFTLNCGRGRVFHETFDPDAKALQHPSIRRIIQRGCQWAGTGKVE